MTEQVLEQARAPPASPPAMERDTICFPRYDTHDIMRRGDPDFASTMNDLYQSAESNALETLLILKTRLRQLPPADFWTELCEGVSQLLGADMSFVMKRMLIDDHDVAVEMPPYGEPGSCMMAAAFHYCAADGSKLNMRETKFTAYGCPCAYMRHDKVFLIPDRLNDFITNNPNKLPTPAEAYIAVPLFADGKCFAHFGVMWSKERALQRRLSWAFIEVLLHSLEDMVQEALLQARSYLRPEPGPVERPRIIPHDAITVAQSLRPYAGSLSHELRTPMQGIVGMLDVMYATVREVVETQMDPKLRSIFLNLQENIEVVQDSSRRAVEAADNVVHAYDMDMSVPDAPAHLSFDEPESMSPFSANVDKRPEILVAGHDLPLARPNKRRRDEVLSRHGSESSAPSKYQKLENSTVPWPRWSEPSPTTVEGVTEIADVLQHATQTAAAMDQASFQSQPPVEETELPEAILQTPARNIAPGLRHTNMREVFRFIVDEGLKVGGRPDQCLATETPTGESIQVRSRGSDGTAKTKTIDWSVDPNVPRSMFIDEKDVSKLVSCVFRNAIKFTDQDGGRIGIYARMSSRSRSISIKIGDNGPGIPAAFLPQLFKAFSRDDHSITRQSEGLGLGLMVAKGIARKLGGDLICTRSETAGPRHGTEFEIRVPVIAGETISRPSSPFQSPRPRAVKPIAPPPPPPIDTPQATANLPSSPVKHPKADDESQSRSERERTPTSPSRSPLHAWSPAQAAAAPATYPPDTSHGVSSALSHPRVRKATSNPEIDRNLALKYPLTFLVAEDNKINRKLLVSMLRKFGYTAIHEAHDGAEAVRQMAVARPRSQQIDVVLMDLWMPLMDGYEATERILGSRRTGSAPPTPRSSGPAVHDDDRDVEPHQQAPTPPSVVPTVLAVSADCTDGALERAAQVGMRGFMTKPYKLHDLQRLITEYCSSSSAVSAAG